MKSSSLDLSKVDVLDFLDALDVENVQEATDEEVQFSCPFPGHMYGDETPSAYMNRESTAWFCHSCKRRGNAITFLAEHENISRYLSIVFLRQEYDSTFKEPVGGSFAAEWDAHFAKQAGASPTEAPVYLDESLVDHFALDWPLGAGASDFPDTPMEYMYERGFTSETLNFWEVGYDEKTDRVVFPVRDVDGRLVGFKGRDWTGGNSPKYLNLGDRPTKDRGYGFGPYNVSQIVYGLDKVKPQRTGIAVEGELNVWAMRQLGYDNVVGLGGSYISPRHAALLKWHFDELIVFFDSLKEEWDEDSEEEIIVVDEAGMKATIQAIEAFQNSMPVKVVDEHLGDPADMIHEPTMIAGLLRGAVSSLHVSMDF